MAKVSAPFLSLGARGSIGGTLTASVWKGIKTMRQKANPANPNTQAQQVQRGLMGSVVNAWRTIGFSAAAKSAWNLAASYAPSPMSGFNVFCKEGIRGLQKNANALTVTHPGTDGFTPTISLNADLSKISDGLDGSATGRTFQFVHGIAPDQLVHTNAAGTSTNATIEQAAPYNTGLSAGDQYFYKVQETTGGVVYDLTGIVEITLGAS